MFCPMCGDEYGDGVARCPEHDVELVKEAPRSNDSFLVADKMAGRAGVRSIFNIVIFSISVYILSTATATILDIRAISDGNAFDRPTWIARDMAYLAGAAARTALILLAATVLLKGYHALGSTLGTPSSLGLDAPTSRGYSAMKALFFVSVVMAALYVGTTLATSESGARREAVAAFQSNLGVATRGEEISELEVDLIRLRQVSFAGGGASLGLMGALMMLRAYRFFERGVGGSSDVEAVGPASR